VKKNEMVLKTMSNVSYIIKETNSMLANGKSKTCGI
jgi:hypothetical protein